MTCLSLILFLPLKSILSHIATVPCGKPYHPVPCIQGQSLDCEILKPREVTRLQGVSSTQSAFRCDKSELGAGGQPQRWDHCRGCLWGGVKETPSLGLVMHYS